MTRQFVWATVTASVPLRVQLDGDIAALPITPDSLIDPTLLAGGDRVRCEISDQRVIVTGRADGTMDAIIQAIIPAGTYRHLAGKTAPTDTHADGRLMWLKSDGSAVSRATYARLCAQIMPTLGTVTMTIASPSVLTKTAHGLVGGQRVYLTTTGALPTGLAANTLYYVLAASLTTNTFRVSLTDGGAAINTSGSQSGVHTLVLCPYGLGNGSTTFNLPDIGDYVLVGQKDGSAEFGSVGRATGEKTHTLTVAEIPPHSHQPGPSGMQTGTASGTGDNPSRGSVGGDTNFRTGAALFVGGAYGSAQVSAGGAHNNLQPSRSALVVIKT